MSSRTQEEGVRETSGIGEEPSEKRSGNTRVKLLGRRGSRRTEEQI